VKIYVITGATSMIGVSLCHHISSQSGNLVYAVCREESSGLNKLPANDQIKIVYSDLANIGNIETEIDQADVFINLAWTNTDHKGRNDSFLQGLNVDYAKNGIHVAARLGCKLFIEAGSQAEYGLVKELITEDTPCNPDTEYGKAKLKVLNEGSALSQSLGLKYIHLRIFSVFGENDRPWTLVSYALDKLTKNENLLLSNCTQYWNYLYSDDCAKQIVNLCHYFIDESHLVTGVYHIASRHTRTLRDYLEEMKYVTNSTGKLLFGSKIPDKTITINPSLEKTEKAIGPINEIPFAEAIKHIVSVNYSINI
jgi:nucleoside-diphosphate-sugar epimerase